MHALLFLPADICDFQQVGGSGRSYSVSGEHNCPPGRSQVPKTKEVQQVRTEQARTCFSLTSVSSR